MKDRAINEAMWDALHILSAAFHPCSRDERIGLQVLADAAEGFAKILVRARKRKLSGAEVQAVVRVVQAALLTTDLDGSTPPPAKDTPPGGIRKL